MNLNNLVQYCRYNDLPDIFEGIRVPSPLSAEAVRAAIMVKCGLLTPIYSEPDVLRQIVTDWFTDKQWNFEHLANIIKAKYSPIENYDRYEDYTDTHSGSGNDTHGGQDVRTDAGTNTDTNSGSDTTTNEVSAENATTYQADNKSTLQHGKSNTFNLNETHTDKYGRTINHTDSYTNSHTAHLHGNIGTTQNVEMINGELQLIGQFDPYKWIASQFENDFCIMVY